MLQYMMKTTFTRAVDSYLLDDNVDDFDDMKIGGEA